MLPVSATAAQIIVIAGCVGLGFSAVGTMFQTFVVRLGDQEQQSRARALEVRMRSELDAAARSSYQRWVAAGLDEAVGLRRDIAERRRAPRDPRTRAA